MKKVFLARIKFVHYFSFHTCSKASRHVTSFQAPAQYIGQADYVIVTRSFSNVRDAAKCNQLEPVHFFVQLAGTNEFCDVRDSVLRGSNDVLDAV